MTVIGPERAKRKHFSRLGFRVRPSQPHRGSLSSMRAGPARGDLIFNLVFGLTLICLPFRGRGHRSGPLAALSDHQPAGISVDRLAARCPRPQGQISAMAKFERCALFPGASVLGRNIWSCA